MSLREYRRKRDFTKTREPRGGTGRRSKALRFVVQKHAARRLHYDFRLELDGVLKSWAVPKGPSLDPATKTLAVRVEDHPIEYAKFEGIIPEGEYGGGTVIVWDQGTWEPLGDAAESLAAGQLKFVLHGEKLRGIWNLVKLSREEKNWLLIKHPDDAARRGDGHGIGERQPESVMSGLRLEQVAESPARVWTKSGAKRLRRSTGAAKNGKPEAAGKSATRKPKGSRTSRLKRAANPESVAGAKPAALPKVISPQLAMLAAQVPKGDRWVHELKFDGYRLLCRIQNGDVRLITRRGNDWTDYFPSVAAAARRLPVEEAMIDGEIVALDERGVSNFQKLQGALKTGDRSLFFYAFDLPYVDGHDLRDATLVDRKLQLQRVLVANGPLNEGVIRYSDHITGEGARVLEEACRSGVEGIVSKLKDSRYETRRTATWLKSKCHQRQEFVIGGMTRPKGQRTGFGALLLGYYRDGELVYCGKVGTGFDEALLDELEQTLKQRAMPKPAFANPPTKERSRITWVRPELVAEVEFLKWTDDGILRDPVFQGLREDKLPSEVGREQPAVEGAAQTEPESENAPMKRSKAARRSTTEETAGDVTLTNPDRILYPDQGITKRQLAEYYITVSDWILPHVVNRPLTLVRCPQGQKGPCFYQKHWTESLPAAVSQVEIQEKDERKLYVVIHDLDGLISLVQISALELHPWGSRVDRLDAPDRIVLDFDPGDGVSWEIVCDAAREAREKLQDLGLESWLRTTGGKGLHVVVPLQRRSTWDEVHRFSQDFATLLARESPQRYTANMRKELRRGKIYVDYLRNRREATAIASYSTRARPGAPVATPLDWSELGRVDAGNAFTLENVPARLRRLKRDPWEEFATSTQALTKGIQTKLAKLAGSRR